MPLRVYKAPEWWSPYLPVRSVFLAGTIEMGKGEPWQDYVVGKLKDTNWTVLNPRRDDWDSSWEQSKDNPQFREQVTWELAGLEEAFCILFYFQPNTLSPISLLELGYVSHPTKRAYQPVVIVVCPQGFWRKGNVDLVCERNHLTQFSTLDEAVEWLCHIGA